MDEKTQMSSKNIFILGLLGGFLLLCTIGFFILIGVVLKGNKSNTNTNVVANTNTTQPTNQAAKTITLKDIKSTDHIRGGKDAKITIIEFSDTECPFCKRFHTTMLEVAKAYGNKIKWVYKHAPLDSHPKAATEAEAAECAADLGGNVAFWKFLDRLYDITPSNNGLDLAKLPEIATFAGLDKTKFEACLKSGKHKQVVSGHLQEAVAAGMSGTPYSVLVSGDQKIPLEGAYSVENMKSIIDSVLE